MFTNLFPNPSKLDIICERYWLLHMGISWDQLPKQANANLTKNPTCLNYEVFICYFGPHGSGLHQYTPSIHVDYHLVTNPIIILGDDLFRVA